MHRKETHTWMKHFDFILFDVLCLQLSYLLAYWTRFPGQNPYLEPTWRSLIVVFTLLDVLVMVFWGTLQGVLKRGYLKELISVFKQVLLVELIVTYFLFVTQEGTTYSRLVLFSTGAIHIVLVYIVRITWKTVLFKRLSLRRTRQLLVGSSDLAKQYAQQLKNSSLKGISITTYLADSPCDGIDNYAGKASSLESYLETNDIDEVVAALSVDEMGQLTNIANLCEKYGTKISVIPFYHNIISSTPSIERVGDMRLLNFRATPLDSLSNELIKRSIDIAASLILILVTSPIMLFAAIGTKGSSPGPILFRQERIGRFKKPFTMLKFRSMRITGTESTGWSTNSDPRKTKFGSFIRKFSIDELPQFFNVLVGQMSLVGPRPEVPYHVEHFKEEVPLYQVRHQVRPGLTGWAQVNGLRGDTSIPERVKYDIWYIENWSVSLDIKIILKTIFGGIVNSEKVKTGEEKAMGADLPKTN